LYSEKILTLSAGVGVVGLGYVGLPLVILVGQKELPVVGIDQDEKRIESIRQGKSYVSDIADYEILALLENGIITVSTDFGKLSSCAVIVVCVPTPLTAGKKPDYSCLINAACSVAAVLSPGQLVIVESTVAPGTTEGIILPILQSGGMKAGSDFFLSYSPERIDPGSREYCLSNIPKLVSGVTPACLNRAQLFYNLLGMTVVPVGTPETAEMAKLLENTYRDVNIALVNEMAQVCRAAGIDIWDVIEAASTKPFGFQAFYPGPGVGGHCVPVDSSYYAFFARENNEPAAFAEHARRVNSAMPQYAAALAREALAAAGKTAAGSRVLVLGAAYKKDVNDARESPVIKLIECLRSEGAEVGYHDPLVEKISTATGEMNSVSLDEITLSGYDCSVLAVAHSTFNLPWLAAHSSMLVDLTGSLPKQAGRVISL
jgi:UDP-N-acetyl-D-glucosamine dehydrogenase